jgi:AraC family transcriptional regulator of arabinose operon
MSYIQNIDLRKMPLYFAYRRKSSKDEQFQEVFHAHQGIEILIVHEGKGTLIIDQKSYEVGPGLICVFQPYQLHHVQMDLSEGTPFVRSIVHYEPSLYESYFDKWPALQAFFKYIHREKLPSPSRFDLAEMERLTSIFLSLDERLLTLSKNHYFEEFSLFLVTFFRTFKHQWELQHKSLSHEQQSRKPHQAERILEWLEHNYKEPLRLEKMSNDLHLSTHHLSHLFKDCTGSSISDYLTAKRMQQAVLLLMSSEYSVARIAEEVGITNCSYFCKLFKNHFGLTPYRYRSTHLIIANRKPLIL